MVDADDDDAGSRADQARLRAEELANRLVRLRSDSPTTDADVARAKEAAENSLRRGIAAHERGADAHRHAAQAHRSAAQVAERTGRHDRAADHRTAAEADEQSAQSDDEAAAADEAKLGRPDAP